jgi:DNA-binding NtrC family response regulator
MEKLKENEMENETKLPQGCHQMLGSLVDHKMPPYDLEGVVKKHILDVLQAFQGNKSAAAKALGISNKTMYNKLHMYGLMGNSSEKT